MSLHSYPEGGFTFVFIGVGMKTLLLICQLGCGVVSLQSAGCLGLNPDTLSVWLSQKYLILFKYLILILNIKNSSISELNVDSNEKGEKEFNPGEPTGSNLAAVFFLLIVFILFICSSFIFIFMAAVIADTQTKQTQNSNELQKPRKKLFLGSPELK